MERPFSAEIKDGRLYGRGAMDTKGGLAVVMVATAEAAKRRLPGDVIFAGVIDEEYASIGTEALLPRVRADSAIVAEPTNLDIDICHKGFVWLEVETKGIAAHGSRFQEGVDAIAKMGKFLVALDDFGKRLESGTRHPILGPASVHASLIYGGQELSSYPESCRVCIERRTIPGESPPQVEAEIQRLLERLNADDPQFSASCRTTFSREPLDVSTESPIVGILREQLSKELGRQPTVGGLSGWTDAALLTANGIPSVVFGPAGQGLHGAEEWVDLQSIRQCCSIVLGAITEFCG
jgi:acetylornithine deacetylase